MARKVLTQQVSISEAARKELDEIQMVMRGKGKSRRETAAGRLTSEAIALLHKRVCK